MPRSVAGAGGVAAAVSVAGGVAAGAGAGAASWLWLMGWLVVGLLPPKLVLLHPAAWLAAARQISERVINVEGFVSTGFSIISLFRIAGTNVIIGPTRPRL